MNWTNSMFGYLFENWNLFCCYCFHSDISCVIVNMLLNEVGVVFYEQYANFNLNLGYKNIYTLFETHMDWELENFFFKQKMQFPFFCIPSAIHCEVNISNTNHMPMCNKPGNGILPTTRQTNFGIELCVAVVGNMHWNSKTQSRYFFS